MSLSKKWNEVFPPGRPYESLVDEENALYELPVPEETLDRLRGDRKRLTNEGDRNHLQGIVAGYHNAQEMTYADVRLMHYRLEIGMKFKEDISFLLPYEVLKRLHDMPAEIRPLDMEEFAYGWLRGVDIFYWKLCIKLDGKKTSGNYYEDVLPPRKEE